MDKTLVEISLCGQYYKKSITDRYIFKNNNIIITNDAVNILDKPQKLYIEPWTKHIEKDKEIKRLNNIINELEKWLEENIKISKAHDNQLGVNVCNTFLNELKGLKEGKQ